MEIIVNSIEETRHLASLFKDFLSLGDVVCLYGDLGAGKTVFAKGLIKSFNPSLDEADIPSPTFTLVQVYDCPVAGSPDSEGLNEDNNTPNTLPQTLWHFDCYRLKQEIEIMEIGLEEALSTGISIIEWAEKIPSYLPRDVLKIYIENVEGDANSRKIIIHSEQDDKWRKLTQALIDNKAHQG